MKPLTKAIAFMLCLSLCISLSACRRETSGSSVDESYLEGLAQGKEDFFMDVWKAAYNLNSKDSGELWETDDFSIVITTIRKTETQLEPNAPHVAIDFTINEGTIERYWKSGNLRFYIYSVCSVCDNGMTEVGNSDWFFDYFELEGTIDGNKCNIDILSIHEDTEYLRVVVVVDDRIYAASYNVDI